MAWHISMPKPGLKFEEKKTTNLVKETKRAFVVALTVAFFSHSAYYGTRFGKSCPNYRYW